jgi:hypothetical protein
MRWHAALPVAGLAALVLAGCGAGPTVDRPRPVGPDVRSLRVSSNIDVEVVHGGRPGAVVRAGRDVIGRVVTATEGDVLRIAVRDRGIVIGSDPLDHVQVQVTLPSLHDVEVDGSAELDLAGMRARTLTFRVRGAGDLEARGRVGHLVTDIRGAGDARLKDLHARTARVSVQGAGSVDVSVSRRLAVLVRGAGDITYHGDPVVTQDISGPGDIHRGR